MNSHAKPAAAAKLFMYGRSRAVRLSEEFRFEGKEVRVRREGDKWIFEPIAKPAFDVQAWRAKLDAVGAADFLTDHPPLLPDDETSFG